MLGLSGVYSQVIDERVKHSNTYEAYISERNALSVTFYTIKDGIIKEERYC